jgi:hypothetical protein
MRIKLMNPDGTTRNNTLWSDGTQHEANLTEQFTLCSAGCIHFYEDELLAVLMNPAHGNFRNPIARRFEPEDEIVTDGTKSGCRAGTTHELVELPDITTNQQIRFGILCALQVYHDDGFVNWANHWLDKSDRSISAYAAADAAAADANAAYADAYAAEKTKQHIDFISLAHQAIREEES